MNLAKRFIDIIFRLSLGPAVVFSLASCGTTNTYNPSQSNFLQQPERLTAADDVPFKQSWRSPDLDWQHYDQILVLPVTLDHMRHPEKVQRDADRMAARGEASQVLADFAVQEFTNVFASDKKKRFQVVSKPSPQTVICEIAITEFQPAKPLVNVAATGLSVAGSAVREVAMNAGSTAAKTTSRGVIAIEVQFKDSRTGQTVFMFADRERGRPSLVNIKDFQKLGHAKAHIRTWAKQTLAVINKKPLQRILDPLPVDLKPW